MHLVLHRPRPECAWFLDHLVIDDLALESREAADAAERVAAESAMVAEHKARGDLLASDLKDTQAQLTDANAFIVDLRAQIEALRGQQNSAYERVKSMRTNR